MEKEEGRACPSKQEAWRVKPDVGAGGQNQTFMCEAVQGSSSRPEDPVAHSPTLALHGGTSSKSFTTLRSKRRKA